jgi:uncharacterized protein YcbX
MRLAAIHVYPVKSCRGRALAEAIVEPWGLAGDRRWMIVDGGERFVTQREEPRLATIAVEVMAEGLELRCGERSLRVATPGPSAPRRPVAVWRSTVPARIADGSLAPLIGRDLRLAYMDDPLSRPVDRDYGRPEDRVSFADGFPLLLASTASLDDLNARMAVALPMDRFRPSVVIEGAPAWAEDFWRRIRIGTAVFRIVKPCARCIVTTTDQATGARGDGGGEPLRTLARFRRRGDEVFFAQNLVPDEAGTIRVGDAVEVLDQAVSANWVA